MGIAENWKKSITSKPECGVIIKNVMLGRQQQDYGAQKVACDI
jgi:hypothetical protein